MDLESNPHFRDRIRRTIYNHISDGTYNICLNSLKTTLFRIKISIKQDNNTTIKTSSDKILSSDFDYESKSPNVEFKEDKKESEADE